MTGLTLILAATIAGWTSTDSWERNHRTIAGETLTVTNLVKTHNGTIDIAADGGLYFTRGSRYIASEGSSAPEIVNVGDGGRFALQGELWVYYLKLNVASGGKAYLDPTKAGFWCGTWQHSEVVNEGLLKLPRGLDFLPASDPGSGFTIVQKSGSLVLGGDLCGKMRLRLEGGEVKVVGDAAILCDAVVTGEVTVEVAEGAGIDFRRVKIADGGKVTPTGKGLFLTDEVRRHRSPGAYGGVVSTVSYRDGKESHWQNPLCGSAPGYWVFLERGKTRVENLRGNRTALWSLNRYSTGYHVAWDRDNAKFDKHTKPLAGPDNAPLDASALASISNSFVRCRENGGTVIPRFAYNGWWAVGVEPPDVATITNHIRQLAEVIAPFRDVIPSVDCGIIGPWGEMHTSKYSDDAALQGERELIVKAWLKYLPKEFFVTVRAPRYLVDDPDRRLGFYNDGYLGTHSDTGTWSGRHDRKWACAFMKDRPYLPYGGEFAGVEEKYAKDNPIFRPGEWNLVREWYETHLAYLRNCGAGNRTTVCRYLLNLRYSKRDFDFEGSPDLSEYEGEDLYRFCRDHMGSRYVVRSVGFTPGALTLAVENTGFCAMPFKSAATVLFERDEKFPDPPVEVAVTGVSASIESVLPGKTERLRFAFGMPKLDKGVWKVYLKLDVPPNRTLRLMNENCWNRDLNANRLLSVEFRRGN